MMTYAFAAVLFVTGVAMASAGKRRPTLAERVDALRPVTAPRPPAPPPLFDSALVRALGLTSAMESLRPAIEAMGNRIARLLRLDTAGITRQLALAGREEPLALFLGTKVIAAVLALVGVPALASIGAIPGVPLWSAVLLAVGAWFAPDLVIREKGRARKIVLENGLAVACLDIALRVAGGAGATEAVREAARASGPFAEELSDALARASAAHRSPADALEDLLQRCGLEEAGDLANALRAAEQGAPLAETVMHQARSIGERHSQEARAAGQRAEILMIVVQAGLVLPGLFILVLYPTATTLIQLSRG